MRSLGRLSAVSIASLPFVLLLSSLGASAQSASTPFAQPSTTPNPSPWVFHVSPSQTLQFAAPQQIQPAANNRVLHLSAEEMKDLIKTPGAQKPVIEAENVSPCYAMRTYGFTTPRDGVSAPQMTSYKTCTPASLTHLKELVITPQPVK